MTEGLAIERTRSADGVEVAACMDSMSKQRREGEANSLMRAKTGQNKLQKPSWSEFVRLADQAVVAIAGADMINRAEPRACGCSRGSRRLDTKRPETGQRQLLRQTKPGWVSEGRRRTRLASSRTGENPLYGMNRGGGGNVGMTRGLFATMLERADMKEAIGLNRSRLHSTRPVRRSPDLPPDSLLLFSSRASCPRLLPETMTRTSADVRQPDGPRNWPDFVTSDRTSKPFL
jgi:hypothetical protein